MPGDGSRFLLVRNKKRGWELPGGTPEVGEVPLDTLMRELAEETGLSGRFICWNKEIYDEGWVGWIETEEKSANVAAWGVNDRGITEAMWHDSIPDMITWDESEIEVLASWILEISNNTSEDE